MNAKLPVLAVLSLALLVGCTAAPHRHIVEEHWYHHDEHGHCDDDRHDCHGRHCRHLHPGELDDFGPEDSHDRPGRCEGWQPIGRYVRDCV